MALRIGFFGNNESEIRDSYLLDGSALMRESGQNMGNLAFWHGLSSILGCDATRIYWHDNPEIHKDKFDIIAIAAANFLIPDNNLIALANIITALDKPVLIAGLGSQAAEDDQIPKLKEGTIAFLRAVSERTPFIGVRGEHSQRVCAHYGVTNTRVLGCPSILANPDQTLGRKIEEKWHQPVENIVSGSLSVKDNLKKSEAWIFEQIREWQGGYVLQRPSCLFKLVRREPLKPAEYEYAMKTINFLNSGMSFDTFRKIVNRNGLVYTSAQSWLEQMRRYSHAFGTRIHGSIFPLIAGVPSICITHDTRTKELADTLHIASMTAKDYGNEKPDVKTLFDSVKFNGELFDENRRYLAGHYIELFNELGLSKSKLLSAFEK